MRPPQADDPVLLCTVRYVLATMIEPLLEEEKVPYSKLALGSSALLGGSTMLENYAFYVPYAAYAGALELLTGIFAEDDEVRMALREAVGIARGRRIDADTKVIYLPLCAKSTGFYARPVLQ